MPVIIGMDPHKRTATVEVIDVDDSGHRPLRHRHRGLR
jgi:hypothetical protein